MCGYFARENSRCDRRFGKTRKIPPDLHLFLFLIYFFVYLEKGHCSQGVFFVFIFWRVVLIYDAVFFSFVTARDVSDEFALFSIVKETLQYTLVVYLRVQFLIIFSTGKCIEFWIMYCSYNTSTDSEFQSW